MTVAGTCVYLCGWELQVIDVSDPAKPVLEGQTETAGGLASIAVSGGCAYGLDFDYGLCAVDVWTPPT